MLKIEKINKSDLDLKVSGQACSDHCMYDCEKVSWAGNRNASQGCSKVTTCNSWFSEKE